MNSVTQIVQTEGSRNNHLKKLKKIQKSARVINKRSHNIPNSMRNRWSQHNKENPNERDNYALNGQKCEQDAQESAPG